MALVPLHRRLLLVLRRGCLLLILRGGALQGVALLWCEALLRRVALLRSVACWMRVPGLSLCKEQRTV